MVLVLCLGDLHVPHRALDLPQKFKQLLVPGKIHRIVCTGNLCTTEMLDYLRSICGDVTITQGDFDESNRWPDTAVITLGGELRIGVCHGHQAVPWSDRAAAAAVARRLDADILVMGNAPSFTAYKQDGRLILHPGSATGAFSTLVSSHSTTQSASPAAATESGSNPQERREPSPSFALMDVNGRQATVYVYELVDGEMKVDKIDFVATASASDNKAAKAEAEER